MPKDFLLLAPLVKRRLLSYLLGLLFLLATNSGQLFIPQILKNAIDHLSLGTPDLGLMGALTMALVGTAILIALARIGWRAFIFGSARRIEADLREKVFSHLVRLSASFYGKNRTGDLMARMTNDLDAVRMALGMALVAFTDGVFLTISILAILFFQNPFLGLMTILPLPVITILILALGKRVGHLFKKVQEEYSTLTNQVQETFQGVRVIKAFVQEKHWIARFDRANEDYKTANLALVKLWGLFFPLIGFLSGISSLVLLWVGGPLVIEERLTPGEFTAYLAYLAMLIWPIMGAGMVVNMLQRGATSLARINEVLRTEPEIESRVGAVTKVERFDLSLRGLSFAFEPEAAPVLKNLQLEIPEGSFLGILGRLGTGKSTLTRLLPRLLDPPPGTLFLGGIDVREYDLPTLRRTFSMVPQNTFLFSDTIRNNIGFSAPEADEALLREMAELSTISRDLEGFSGGWETQVGERGIALSGGQKQRVALSRALVPKAPILILDDALSAVDVKTEEKIIDHLLRERQGLTNILISHRVNTLSRCSRIIVLEDGAIIQEGTHESLMSEDGTYREIYLLQNLHAVRKNP